MQTRQWNFVDKSGWGNGPWAQEPDKRQWLDHYTGLPCLAVRNHELGSWCGYVGVERGHPWYGMDYCSVPAHAHGGLTFSDKCEPNTKRGDHGVCHVVDSGDNDDVWWLGFDCAHYEDFMPGTESRLREAIPNRLTTNQVGIYRTVEYVADQCADLAHQAKQAAKPIARVRAALARFRAKVAA